ncbi:MAG: ATP-binding protein [Proteobacteria bacterium]|nr:ATP-binding protein [Pseudomonadota bacterium]
MIKRSLEAKLKALAEKSPVIAVTGPRQSGKTTLVRAAFAGYKYVSLENLDTREFALADPRLFLSKYPAPAIFDEIQRAPSLLSYIQTIVDEAGRNGMYILTGSNNLMLLEGVSQSLAGRVALLNLLPFSAGELAAGRHLPATLEENLFKGGYPRVYDKKLTPEEFYSGYVATYVERDIRQILKVTDLHKFQIFLKMCAARCGQLVNLSALGNDCGINHATAKAWLSVLQTCYIAHLLPPHFENMGKRLMKSPKLYFYDTGLLCHLLGIQKAEELAVHPMRGYIFESWALGELLKNLFNRGRHSNLYFWRDHVGHEVDCLVDDGLKMTAIEIKSAVTLSEEQFKGLKYFKELAGKKHVDNVLVYAGKESMRRTSAEVAAWRTFGIQLAGELAG